MKKMLTVFIAMALLLCSALAAAETASQAELPAYVYPGEDPIVGAVANYSAEHASQYWDHDVACVTIPAPVIHKTVTVDDTHTDVYGSFWILKYTLEGRTLVCVSGGEEPGIMHLELADQGWTVASVETSGDGDDYTADIIRFCNGDKELEAAYFGSADAQQDPLKAVRTQFIREYVEANQLPIDSYQDPYWDAVPLYE